MAIDIDIRIGGSRELFRALNRFDRDVAQRATAQALNRTINNMRATAITLGAQYLGVAKSEIVKRFRFDINTKHGAIGIVGARARVRMEARAVASGRPFNLIRWDAHAVPGGVVANAWGESKLYRGLGITRNPANFVFVVNRGRREKKRIGRGAFGPGLTHALQRTGIQRAIEREGEEKFAQHFASAANYHLSRNGWRARV